VTGDAARMSGITIPTLCHQQNETPVGVCRLCVVDVKGARVYAASCVRQVEPGMVVKTATHDVDGVRRTLLELLMADHPTPCSRQQQTQDCELERLATHAGLTAPRFPGLPTPRGHDESSASIAVDQARETYEATKSERIFQERTLADEQQKLEVGASTSFVVIQFQRDLAAARSAEVSALASYQKAKTALQRATGTILDDYQVVLDDAFRGAIQQSSAPPGTP